MTDKEHRINALRDNAEWLANNDLDDKRAEAGKRLLCMMADIQAVLQGLGENDA